MEVGNTADDRASLAELDQKTAAAELGLTRLLAWLEPELVRGQDTRDIAAVIEAAEAWLALLNARKRVGSGKRGKASRS